ncbi:uncharacterized protein I303_100958 [Kwoniella dejecticola CBS 10117]|uniref:NADH:flavin oxidoreductase/NADH oxidase n=1 Tax=Kwoniella dejecticola CBS 10117 TaxID=1296121 RepID=A0A1A6AGD6_9TREE|nr:NADH:flavin oxidoreductase/NADH oxidase [Kwoniella dejecticola CBS 10117]OBR89140.1 NADH:flavin oxidoreductase/NADH oxidase [Kwoniella dejecticola CBS 10117]
MADHAPVEARADDIDVIRRSLTLPNGVTIKNRLVKAAMAEGIGLGGGPPREGHLKLYEEWAQGGWGMIISGNAQIDPKQLASPHDLTLPDHPSTLKRYTKLASSVHRTPDSPLLLMQISHPGLQSSSTINLSRWPWESAIAPCSDRPTVSDGPIGWLWSRAVWPVQSRQITPVDEWLGIVKKFVDGAVLAEKAGWDGVQIHSAHGYLLAEYLSPLANPNPRPLPGVPDHLSVRLHLLYLILEGVRENTSKGFIKAVKINCSDFVQGGIDEKQATEIVKTLVSWSMLDIIEISGGTYSSPAFASPESLKSPSARQSLFAHFTSSLLPSIPSPPNGPAILLTGGLHDRRLIASSLRERACDLVGIGRPACLHPDLPNKTILDEGTPDEQATLGGYPIPGSGLMRVLLGGGGNSPTRGIKLVGAGISTMWHEWQLCRIGRGVEPDPDMHWLRGLIIEEIWYEVIIGLWISMWRFWTRQVFE